MQASQFPDIDHALEEPNGLLAQGGILTPKLLLDAYSHGIFPWPSGTPSQAHNEPENTREANEFKTAMLWWSPNPRAVLFPDKIYCSRSLRKNLKRCEYRITLNQAFKEVVHRCANVSRKSLDGDESGTWITEDIKRAYCKLHKLGHAHSIEIWDGKALVGGLYGVVVGQLFCGESMFHHKTDASKMALLALASYLKQIDWPLIDCQVENPHLSSLGAELISRSEFKKYLPHPQEQTDNATQATEFFSQQHWPFESTRQLLEHLR